MIRAAVRRDGPGEWSWTLSDDHGDVVTGLSASWGAALGEATDELRLMAEAGQPPAFELPIIRERKTPDASLSDVATAHVARQAPLRAPWRRWLGL